MRIIGTLFVAGCIMLCVAAGVAAAGTGDGISELPDGSVLFQLEESVANQQPPGNQTYMGGAIAIGAEYMVIAAPSAHWIDGGDSGEGVALVYALQGMDLQTPPTLFGIIRLPYEPGDLTDFSLLSLAIQDDELLIGAGGASGGGGGVFIYKFDNLTTPFQSMPFNPWGDSTSRLGTSVTWLPDGPKGRMFLVGAPATGAGAVVLYGWEEENGYYDAWDAIYAPPELSEYASFGASLSCLNGAVAVGAPNADIGSFYWSGLVFILEYINDATGYAITQTIAPPNPADAMAFGTSVSIREEMLAVGAPVTDQNDPGAVYMYAADADSGTYGLVATLAPVISTEEDKFGTSVSLGPGLTLAVGTPRAIDDGYVSGACVLFEYAEASPQLWIESGRLTSHLGASYAAFGQQVAFRMDEAGNTVGPFRTLLAGAPWGETAHMYHSQDPTDPWADDVRVPAPIRLEDAVTGVGIDAGLDTWSVAIDGDRMVVGDAAGAGAGIGRVQLYERDFTGQWDLRRTWTAPDAWTGFGADVDISGDVVVIGADSADSLGYPGEDSYGAVYVAYFSESSEEWGDANALWDPGDVYGFGQSVAIANGEDIWNTPATIAIGEGQNAFNPGSNGRVHIYSFQFGYGLNQGYLEPEFLNVDDDNPGFGASLDLDQGTLVVGAPHKAIEGATEDCFTGAVYVYDGAFDDVYDGDFDGTPLYIVNPLGTQDCSAPTLQGGGTFGTDVAIADGRLVVGAPRSGIPSRLDSGLAWLIEVNDPTIIRPLTPLNLRPGDSFGSSVAIDANTVLVGAPGSDFGAVNGGLAWRFSPQTGVPSEGLMLGEISHHAQLGSSVAVGSSGSGLATTITMLAAAPTQSQPDDGFGVVGSFTSAVVANWIASGDGWYEADSNASGFWSMAPEDAAQWRFSKMLGDQFTVEMWDSSSVGSGVEVSLADVRFQGWGPGAVFWVEGGLAVDGPASLGLSRLTLEDLTPLTVVGPIDIGSSESAGTFAMAGNASVEVLDTLTLHVGASLSLVTSTYDGSPIIDCSSGTLAVGGTCTVVDAPATVRLGDRFVLLQSATAPADGNDRFDMVVLPGLEEGLAFQLVYGEVDSLQGTVWQAAIEVVDLADLIGFDDGGNFAVAGDPIDLELTDLNGDGADEICVLFGGAPGSLYIFENDGSGGMVQQIIIDVGNGPIDLTSGDIDGSDGQDLLVANFLSASLTLLFNDGDFTDGFSQVDFPLTTSPTCLAAITLDDDGLDDLVVGLIDSDGDGNGYWQLFHGTNSILGGGLGGGGGADAPGFPIVIDPSEEEGQKDFVFFGATGHKSSNGTMLGGVAGPVLTLVNVTVGSDVNGVTSGDFDDDGDMDVALTDAGNGNLIMLLRDDASLTFAQPLNVAIGTAPGRVVAADLDDDGFMDLAALTTNDVGQRVVRVLQNDSNLAWTSVDAAEGDEPAIFGAGDISGNGTQEIVTVSSTGSFARNGVQLVERRPVNGGCSGDFDGDGSVDVDDVLALLASYLLNGDGDCDDDGDTDVDDLLILLGNYGPC